MLKSCSICNNTFESKRKDAKFCSAKCRVTHNRITDNSVTDNLIIPNAVVTDKLSVGVPITSKDSWLCKIEGCNLINMPGHGGMCIYHWRISENLSTIPEEQYNELNIPC